MTRSVSVIILLIGLCTHLCFAQSCIGEFESIIFDTQSKVDNFSFNYPGCTEILGSVAITNEVTSLEELSSITSIGGNLTISNTSDLISLDGLDNLSQIGGHLIIRGDTSLQNIDALANLNSVAFDIRIEQNESLTSIDGLASLNPPILRLDLIDNPSLSNLDALLNQSSIAGDLTIRNLPLLTNLNSLANLTSVGNITITEIDQLVDLEGLNNLTMTQGSFWLSRNNQLESFNGLENLTSIGGDLRIDQNHSLTDITNLISLDSIGGGLDITRDSSLKSLEGLANITSIGGLEIFQIDIKNLDDLSSLTSIDGSIVLNSNDSLENIDALRNVSNDLSLLLIFGNPLLKNLDGLMSINSVQVLFNIQANDALTDIKALANLQYIFGTLVIQDNPLLSECSYRPICQRAAPGGSMLISGNLEGCSSRQEILAKCRSRSFSGNVFYDFNQNQVQDSFEFGIPRQVIDVQTMSSEVDLYTSSSGRYATTCIPGQEYTFSLLEDPDWTLTTDSTSYTTIFQSGHPANENNNFGLYPTFENHNYNVRISSGQSRCDTKVDFRLGVCNQGTFLETGEGLVTLNYSDIGEYVEAYPEPFLVDLTSQLVTWKYDTLYPWQCLDYKITFRMPNFEFIGETFDLTASAFRDSLGTSVLAGERRLATTIVCSYDPNDKLVNPMGEQEANLTPKDEPLDYTVRFQNTGNIFAIDVFIQDTLDANLDWDSFRFIQASHEVEISRTEDSILTFYFRDIYLPDSLSDPLGSQGFVRYQIDPIAGLADSSTVENTAHIYFDSNPPIVTNTTLNTLVDEIPVYTEEANLNQIIDLKVFPNPTTGQLQCSLPELPNVSAYQLQLMDMTGRITKEWGNIPRFGSLNLDISNRNNGIYTLLARDATTGKILAITRLILMK